MFLLCLYICFHLVCVFVSHYFLRTSELGKPWNVPKGGKLDMRTSSKEKRETGVADSTPDAMKEGTVGVEEGSTLLTALKFSKGCFERSPLEK